MSNVSTRSSATGQGTVKFPNPDLLVRLYIAALAAIAGTLFWLKGCH